MKFDYLKQPNFTNPAQKWSSRPLIPVRLLREGRHLDVYALIDSGADASLFHTSIAKELGIDVLSGRKERFFGISGDDVDVFVHPVRLQVLGSDEGIDLEAGFTEARGVGAILGQSDFFDRYRIVFERHKGRVEITPAKEG